MKITRHLALLFAPLCLSTILPAQDAVPTQEDYYPITRIPVPEEMTLEASGITRLPDGTLLVSTRRGDIYALHDPLGEPEAMKWTLWARGLHEPLGIHFDDGWVYATQRAEVTKIRDSDGDGRADQFETLSDDWGISGDYHEYAFGSSFDPEGHMWVVLCLTGSFGSNTPYRGWCLRIDKAGNMIPTASGIRSPGGIGLNHLGDVFYSDNQGPWNGSSSLKHLAPGSFQSHPGGWKWFDLDAVKEEGLKQPVEPNDESRSVTERERIAEYVPPACVLPHNKLGKSTSCLSFADNDKFGPFKNQLLVSDQSFSNVSRVVLEKVNGVYQGAAILLLNGCGSGNIASYYDQSSGQLFVGGSDRGWGARGGNRFAIDRIGWTGKTPFEIHEMRAKPDGFELTFTEPVDAETAADPASYEMQAWTYILQSKYGSPEVDHVEPKIVAATVAADGKSVRLQIEGLVKGHMHHLQAKGLKSKVGLPLLHSDAYYTLNEIPSS